MYCVAAMCLTYTDCNSGRVRTSELKRPPSKYLGGREDREEGRKQD